MVPDRVTTYLSDRAFDHFEQSLSEHKPVLKSLLLEDEQGLSHIGQELRNATLRLVKEGPPTALKVIIKEADVFTVSNKRQPLNKKKK